MLAALSVNSVTAQHPGEVTGGLRRCRGRVLAARTTSGFYRRVHLPIQFGKHIMNHRIRYSCVALLLTTLLAPALVAQSAASLKVALDRPKSPVSSTLYGLMTEEINYSYDGGLYAELIRNRTFRSDWSGILNWFLIEKGTSAAKIGVDPKDGPSTAIPNSAKFEVTKADANSPAGLINEGYWGIAVRPNSRYNGSFFAKAGADGSLPVKVALVADQSGQVLAAASVPVAGTAWKEYKFEMQSGSTPVSSENHFEITIDRPATLWLQLVSLFPPTYHNRERTATGWTSWRNWRRCILRSCDSREAIIWRAETFQTRFDWKKDDLDLSSTGRRTRPPGVITRATAWASSNTIGIGARIWRQWSRCSRFTPGTSAGRPGSETRPRPRPLCAGGVG